jgi:hypothetical protein
MSKRTTPSTLGLDGDLDPATNPPDDQPPTATVADQDPSPSPEPPAWVTTIADRVGCELCLYSMNKLPILRMKAVQSLSEPEPLRLVSPDAIRSAIRGAASNALGFLHCGDAERSAVLAWMDAVAEEVIERRAGRRATALERQAAEEQAERDRIWRIENAEKLALAARRDEYTAWLAANPQPEVVS